MRKHWYLFSLVFCVMALIVFPATVEAAKSRNLNGKNRTTMGDIK